MEQNILDLLTASKADKQNHHKNEVLYSRKAYPLSKKQKKEGKSMSIKTKARPAHKSQEEVCSTIQSMFESEGHFEKVYELLKHANS